MSRRQLLRAAVSTLALPSLVVATSTDAAASRGAPIFVFVFLRGALDGLSAVVPHQEPRYYELRDNIAIARPGKGKESAIDLDGQFGFHPALAPLLPAFRAGELAVVHAFGLQHETRSHFDAQDFVELGTPGNQHGPGWLTRLLDASSFDVDAVPAVAFEESLPRSLYGFERAFVVEGLESVRAHGDGALPDAARAAFERMYTAPSEAEPVRRTGADLFRLLKRLEPLLDEAPKGS